VNSLPATEAGTRRSTSTAAAGTHVRVFFEHHRELPDQARRQIRVKRDRYERLIRGAVTDGIRGGEFRDVDPEAATMAVFGVCNWAYQWWRPGGTADPAHTAQKMWDLIIRGLTASPDQPKVPWRHFPR
jgi:TetR/AcrR family transcriptional regulator, cholesterol catabolism regulator